jgi:hypothetical protein
MLAVEASFFRKVTDSSELGIGMRLSEEADRSGIGTDDVHQYSNQCGFAGAVGSQQAEDLSLLNMEGHFTQSDIVAVAFLYSVEINKCHRDIRVQ